MTAKQQIQLKTSAKATLVAGFATLLFLFGGFGAWAALSEISGAVIASGQIVVKGKPKTVQHLDGGVVADIRVEETDLVKKGDLLIRLDDVLLKANLEIYRNRLIEALVLKSRLEAERDRLDAIEWSEDFARTLDLTLSDDAKRGQENVFNARTSTLEGQLASTAEKTRQLTDQRRGAEGLRKARQKQLEIVQDELVGLVDLQKQGHTSRTRVLALQREEAELSGDIAEIEGQLAQLGSAISESELQALQIRKEFDEGVLTELVRARSEANEMIQQMIATRQQLERVDIFSPIDGIVHELNVSTIGGVVGPGDVLMQVIPINHLAIEANVEPQFVDQLFIGQEAALRFSAFNQRTTPELEGRLSAISPNTIVNEQTGLSFYRVHVEVEESELSRLGTVALVPGMPVEVFAKTEERTPLSYLIKPLTDQISKAWREE